MKKLITVFFIVIFFFNIISFVNADWIPTGNINGRNLYNITNFTFVNATLFYGNGSQLTGLMGSQILNNYNWINHTNLSQFTNDNNFWNDTYATFNKTYADTLYYGINNPNNYYNSTTLPDLNSTGLIINWSYLTNEIDLSNYVPYNNANNNLNLGNYNITSSNGFFNKVGINTTTPQNTLNVVGDGNFTGNLTSNKLIIKDNITSGYMETYMYNGSIYQIIH